MTRRDFVGASLAATAAAPKAVAANDKVALGVVGVGGRGRSLTSLALTLPSARVTHLCDVDQANLERAAAQVREKGGGTVQQVTDMRRLFDDKSVDAVLIATPDHWHSPAAILACDAGKDVYVEKPLSHNLREGRLLIDAARRNNRIVQHGTQSRSRPSTIRAIEYVKSGKIGKVVMAKAWNVQLRKNIGHKDDGPVPRGVDYETWLGPAPWIPFNENRFHYNWHWHWHFGTGDMGNDGVHQIDIARWALGVSYPLRVSGMGRKIFFDDDQQTPDTMNIVYDFGPKALIFEQRIWAPYGMDNIDNGVAVYGSDAMVHIGRWDGKWGFKVFDKDGKEVLHDPEKADDTHMQNFLDCVKSRALPNADVGIGHMSALLAHLGNIVSRTGRNLEFDQGTESIIGDPQANLYTGRKYRTHWATPKLG